MAALDDDPERIEAAIAAWERINERFDTTGQDDPDFIASQLRSALAVLLPDSFRESDDEATTARLVRQAIRTAGIQTMMAVTRATAVLANTLASTGNTGSAGVWLRVAEDGMDRWASDLEPEARATIQVGIENTYDQIRMITGESMELDLGDGSTPLTIFFATLAKLMAAYSDPARIAAALDAVKALRQMPMSITPEISALRLIIDALSHGLQTGDPLERFEGLKSVLPWVGQGSLDHLGSCAVLSMLVLIAAETGQIEKVAIGLAVLARQRARSGPPLLSWLVYGTTALSLDKLGRGEAAAMMAKLAAMHVIRALDDHVSNDAWLRVFEGRAAEILRVATSVLSHTGRIGEAEMLGHVRQARSGTGLPEIGLSPIERDWLESVEAAGDDIESGIVPALDAREGLRARLSPAPRVSVGAIGHALLVFRQDNDAMLCWVEQSSAPPIIIRLLVPARELFNLAFDLRNVIRKRTLGWRALAEAGWSALIEGPALHLRRDVKTLSIDAPDGLAMLPWAALSDGKCLLVERWALLRAVPGVSMASRPLPAHVRLTSFATTVAHDATMTPLGVNAAEESASVAVLAGGTSLVDGAFSASALRHALRTADIVHVASHFRMRHADLLKSDLLLGDGGLMTLSDLLAEDLSSIEMLIMSACGTAATGETIDGPRTVDALLIARGVGSVLGTLWPVDSGTMAAVIPRLVSLMAVGLGKADALAQLQREMLSGVLGGGEFAHPFYFAPLVVAGDSRAIPASSWLRR